MVMTRYDKMIFCLKLLLALLLCLRQETGLAILNRKFVYQRDMSEYCRRRAVPSVFVGRHVIEANSQILHFSRMELPYSCFISVRTESGSNLILVIQLESGESLTRSCAESGNQLSVYEMGETFGGYWGPLPDTVIKPEPVGRTKFYTLKTTESTMEMSATEEDVDSDEETTEYSSLSVSNQTRATESDDYIRMEIPIVNVSGKLSPGDGSQDNAFDLDETFDFIYDVTPRPGSKYETSILPLVQFSIRKQADIRRDDSSPLYQLDVVDKFTPDMRLTLPQRYSTIKKIKMNRKNRLSANRRYDYKKRRTFFKANSSSFSKKYASNSRVPLRIATRPIARNNIIKKQRLSTNKIKTFLNNTNIAHNSTSWKVIDDLMKKLNKTLNVTKKNANFGNIFITLQNPNNMTQSNSGYLDQQGVTFTMEHEHLTNRVSHNEFIHKNRLVTKTSEYSFTGSTRRLVSISYRTNLHKIIKPDSVSASFTSTLSIATDNTKIESTTVPQTSSTSEYFYNTSYDNTIYPLDSNNSVQNITSDKEPAGLDIGTYNTTEHLEAETYPALNTEKPLRGSMVDHESWENVVQAAPVMAVLLNRTVANNKENTIDGESQIGTQKSKIALRKKRYVHSISILNARPHNLTTSRDTSSTNKVTYRISDLQDFAQLVELQDDEMHGRVALRFLRPYVGPAVFNICENHGNDTFERHIFLFNSSRIVLAISNFTMDRMSVVLTPARTLLAADERCKAEYLECQVSGTRVCVDSLTACDGVPNCGSYDIYDEDRLRCGAAVGLQHNVCIAAFAFMAVLLTILYIVHYWLKRCVPKVAEAFFIYTNGIENILYLDSIMRSPTDVDEDLKIHYHGSLFDDYNIYGGSQMKPEKRKFGGFLKNIFLFNIFRRKKKLKGSQEVIESEFPSITQEPKKMYSFTELQIRKMIGKELAEASVQTGDSLEMTHLQKVENKEKVIKSQKMESLQKPTYTGYETPMAISDSLLTLAEPLPEHKHVDELSILKFLRDARSDSIRSTDKLLTTGKKKDIIREIKADEEMEIKSHDYELHGQIKAPKSTGTTITTKCEVHSQKPEPPANSRKRLRFEAEAKTIPSSDYDQEGNETLSQRRSVVLGSKKWGNQDLETIEESEEQSPNRDHRRFWSSSKVKKAKKKPHVTLR